MTDRPTIQMIESALTVGRRAAAEFNANKLCQHEFEYILYAASQYVATPDLHVIREAAKDVLEYRTGELPTEGWLRDNDRSRAALAKLAAAVAEPA